VATRLGVTTDQLKHAYIRARATPPATRKPKPKPADRRPPSARDQPDYPSRRRRTHR
jgi:hypothetical protein